MHLHLNVHHFGLLFDYQNYVISFCYPNVIEFFCTYSLECNLSVYFPDISSICCNNKVDLLS